MGVNGEALQLDAVYKKPYFLLQVKWESVSGTTCVWMYNEIEGSLMKLFTKLYQKKYHSFVAVGIVTHNSKKWNWRFVTHNGNKLVIFSSIALYYGDTYSLLYQTYIFFVSW